MKKELISFINIKIAISLNKLLESSKKIQRTNSEKASAESYNDIALEADLRKATVSDAFNAKSKTGPNSVTIILIVKAMGYELVEFAKVYDTISEADIIMFKIKQS